jgi:hypothetical protein
MSCTAQCSKRVDFVTRSCGLCLPTLFQRIGSMAAVGQPLPTRFNAAHRPCVQRYELTRCAGSPTLTNIAFGPAQVPSQARLDNRIRVKVGKPSSRPIAHCQQRWRQPMTARAGPCS